MEMKKLTYSLLLAAAVSPAGAQTLHESISVEGKYVPDIIRLDRLYAFPEAGVFPLETSPMPYEWKGVAAAFEPSLMAMPVTGWRVSRVNRPHRGYLEADLGSWLNSNLSAGGRFVDSSSTAVGAWLQFNSSSLWNPNLSEATADRQLFRYDGTLGIYAGHRFGDSGRLDAALSWQTGYFNYFTWIPAVAADAPSQTLNDVAFNVKWTSPVRVGSVMWHADASTRSFGYRRFYLPELQDGVKPARETRVSVEGGVVMPWESGSSIGLDAEADVMLYSEQDNVVTAAGSLLAPENYTQVSLTPFYRFSKGKLNIRVGAEIDLTFNAGLPDARYSAFHIAPDVRLDLQSGPVGLWLNVLGGSRLQTLASLHEDDYYSMPVLSNTRPVYSPFDASLGVSFGPFSGFSAGIEFAYKSVVRTPLGGWYSWMLADYGSPWRDNPDMAGMSPLYGFDTEGLTVKGMSLGLDLAYTTGKIFSAKASAHYQPQREGTGYFNGYDRPRWLLDASMTVNPWKTLKFDVGYSYRGVRNIYTRMKVANPTVSIDGSATETRVAAMRLPDLCMLNLGVSYDFTPNFGLRVEAMNLLDRHDALLPALPSEGLCITGGLKLLF